MSRLPRTAAGRALLDSLTDKDWGKARLDMSSRIRSIEAEARVETVRRVEAALHVIEYAHDDLVQIDPPVCGWCRRRAAALVAELAEGHAE